MPSVVGILNAESNVLFETEKIIGNDLSLSITIEIMFFVKISNNYWGVKLKKSHVVFRFLENQM